MSQISSLESSSIEQTELFNQLDVAFTLFFILAGIITFPPACFVYWRMLTLKSFQNQYLMKLFVLNGASNGLIYLGHLIAIQFANWPSCFWFYSWFSSTVLGVFFRFSQDASKSFMWQTTFFISLNRLLSLTNQSLLKKNDFNFFLFASVFSLISSLAICFPLFFSHYSYVQFTIEEDVYAFIPQIPKPYRWTSTPALIYQATLAAGTLLVNVGISYFLVKLRKEYSSKRRKRPEQGRGCMHRLIISSFVALLMHALNDSLKHASKSFKDDTISYVIPLTIAISTTLPFWTMIIFAHSLRHALLTGEGFERSLASFRRRRTMRARGATMSAAF